MSRDTWVVALNFVDGHACFGACGLCTAVAIVAVLRIGRVTSQREPSSIREDLREWSNSVLTDAAPRTEASVMTGWLKLPKGKRSLSIRLKRQVVSERARQRRASQRQRSLRTWPADTNNTRRSYRNGATRSSRAQRKGTVAGLETVLLLVPKASPDALYNLAVICQQVLLTGNDAVFEPVAGVLPWSTGRSSWAMIRERPRLSLGCCAPRTAVMSTVTH